MVCAADVTGFGFVFVSRWYRELVGYRQAATPLWLRDCGFYPVSMARNPRSPVIEALRLSPTCRQRETCVGGGRAMQEQVPHDGEFHRADAWAQPGNTNVWQAETSVEWSRADRRAYRLISATASSVAVGPNMGSPRVPKTDCRSPEPMRGFHERSLEFHEQAAWRPRSVQPVGGTAGAGRGEDHSGPDRGNAVRQ